MGYDQRQCGLGPSYVSPTAGALRKCAKVLLNDITRQWGGGAPEAHLIGGAGEACGCVQLIADIVGWAWATAGGCHSESRRAQLAVSRVLRPRLTRGVGWTRRARDLASNGLGLGYGVTANEFNLLRRCMCQQDTQHICCQQPGCKYRSGTSRTCR